MSSDVDADRNFIDRMLFRIIPVALLNTYTNLYYGRRNFITLSWHFVLHYIVICRFL